MTEQAPIVHVRHYPAIPELDLRRKRHPLPPPIDLFARLTRLEIRLQDAGQRLRAEVPEAALGNSGWPALDRALAHYAPYLADQAAVVKTVHKRFDPEALRAALRRFGPPLVEVWARDRGRREEVGATARRTASRSQAGPRVRCIRPAVGGGDGGGS